MFLDDSACKPRVLGKPSGRVQGRAGPEFNRRLRSPRGCARPDDHRGRRSSSGQLGRIRPRRSPRTPITSGPLGLRLREPIGRGVLMSRSLHVRQRAPAAPARYAAATPPALMFAAPPRRIASRTKIASDADRPRWSDTRTKRRTPFLKGSLRKHALGGEAHSTRALVP